METQDRILKQFPDFFSVHGKAGRADTSTDPAPFSMMEAVVQLKPVSEWPPKQRFFSSWPGPLRATPGHTPAPTHFARGPDQRDGPGGAPPGQRQCLSDADQESHSICSPRALGPRSASRSSGPTSTKSSASASASRVLFAMCRAPAAFSPNAPAGGYFVDITPRRRGARAAPGLTIDDVQNVIMCDWRRNDFHDHLEGRGKLSIKLRYPRDLRENLDQLERVLVMAPMGRQVPLKEVADISLVNGPSMIRDENGMLAGYVYVDITGRDVGGYVEDAKRAVGAGLKLPTG